MGLVPLSTGLMPMADPGFPQVGGANSLGGGRQHTILPNFPEDSMKSKELGGWGACITRPP